MNRTFGVLAHVDAGKTSFCEQLLYRAHAVRLLGRVDEGKSLLDSHPIERARGITIFSGQADFSLGGDTYYLIDTPGHSDFYGQTERAIAAMDAAVLLVSGTEGPQGSTRMLFDLLEKSAVPTFFFINKTDRPECSLPTVLAALQCRLSPEVLDFSGFPLTAKAPVPKALLETLAERDEPLLDAYLSGSVPWEFLLSRVRELIQNRRVFPCLNGSALTGEGIDAFLSAFRLLFPETCQAEELPFSGRVYRISHDGTGKRLFHLKVLSGRLCPKDPVDVLTEEGVQPQKVNELFRGQGDRCTPLSEALCGQLCTVAGLSGARAGDVIGRSPARGIGRITPAFSCRVLCGSVPDRTVLNWLRQLETEEPLLGVCWQQECREILVQVMGAVQLEVLRQLILERFKQTVSFGPPQVLYRETLTAPVRGCGHFEPLRHYAEVHLLLSPGERGSGITFESCCSTDDLALNWQRLIETHVFEQSHPGVLTGAPLTDVKVTLLAGRAHLKHTEGGDFRQAVCRAIRQGLACGKSLLLEPYYAFEARVPADRLGRVMADIQRMNGTFDPPGAQGETAFLTGTIPVSECLSYPLEFASLTRGQGSLSLLFGGYFPCHDSERVIAERGYDFERDAAHPADSVFCSHGAGYAVSWREAPAAMHLQL